MKLFRDKRSGESRAYVVTVNLPESPAHGKKLLVYATRTDEARKGAVKRLRKQGIAIKSDAKYYMVSLRSSALRAAGHTGWVGMRVAKEWDSRISA